MRDMLGPATYPGVLIGMASLDDPAWNPGPGSGHETVSHRLYHAGNDHLESLLQ